jgi:hypothetical protein
VRTHDDPAVAAGFSVDPGRWLGQFEELMGRIAGRFARVELICPELSGQRICG